MPWSDVTMTSVLSSSPAASSGLERPADVGVGVLDLDGVVEQVARGRSACPAGTAGTFTSASFLPSRTPEPGS